MRKREVNHYCICVYTTDKVIKEKCMWKYVSDMSITRQGNKERVVFSYEATNMQQWKEHTPGTFNNMDESKKKKKYYVEQNKPGEENAYFLTLCT